MINRSELTVRFEKDIATYRDQLYPAALHLTRNHHDAEDLVQDTCVKAFARLDQYQGGSMRSWMRTILQNNFTDQYRKQRHEAVPARPVKFEEEWYTNANGLKPPPRSAEVQALELLPNSELSRPFTGSLSSSGPRSTWPTSRNIRSRRLPTGPASRSGP
jgi:RNA polymerase sigma-70 factor, ECF subfamily